MKGWKKIFGYMEGEIGVLQVEKKIRTRVKKQMEKTQRDYYLNEQMKAIQKELGETEEGKNETDELGKENQRNQDEQGSDRERRSPKLKKLVRHAANVGGINSCAQLPPTGCWASPGTNARARAATSRRPKAF